LKTPLLIISGGIVAPSTPMPLVFPKSGNRFSLPKKFNITSTPMPLVELRVNQFPLSLSQLPNQKLETQQLSNLDPGSDTYPDDRSSRRALAAAELQRFGSPFNQRDPRCRFANG